MIVHESHQRASVCVRTREILSLCHDPQLFGHTVRECLHTVSERCLEFERADLLQLPTALVARQPGGKP